MPTVRLTLAWPDGAKVTARLTPAAANDEAAVVYAGALERLPKLWEQCRATTLRAFFQQIATATGARFTERQSGLWPDESDVVG